MYFLRWLTGHPVMLIVLITFVYALINWSNLFHWFDDGKMAAGHTVEVTHEAAPASEEVTAHAPQIIEEVAEEVVVTVETAVTEPAPVEGDATAHGAEAGLLGRIFEGEEAAEVVDAGAEGVAPTAATAEKKPLFGFFKKKEDSSGKSGTHNEFLMLLASARKAFWDKDMEASAAIYKELISAQPDNPDLLTEYGNLLVQTKQLDEAVDTYEKASYMLIEQKRYEEVNPLIGFIGSFDPARADKVVEKLHSQ